MLHRRYVWCWLFCLPLLANAQYTGTGSVSQGIGTALIPDLFSCGGGRVPPVGMVVDTDSTSWVAPSAVHFQDVAFPFASDLFNSCSGATFANTADALSALTGSDVVVIDPGGELITGFLFADNYFELYVNGVPVGKDKVPYTPFNSSIVRFRVNRPFSIAVLLVDWEENPGIGTESNAGFSHHAGDGGLAAIFRDSLGNVVALTGPHWKAQTFYTSPVTDLACPAEIGSLRLSDACTIQDSNNGSAYYALHWPRPANWYDPAFDDSYWPAASVFTNATVGVSGKPAYENFPDVFDDPAHDAAFIWSTNLVLDNEVIVRHRVDALSGLEGDGLDTPALRVFPNPVESTARLWFSGAVPDDSSVQFRLLDAFGRICLESSFIPEEINVHGLAAGNYIVQIMSEKGVYVSRLIVR